MTDDDRGPGPDAPPTEPARGPDGVSAAVGALVRQTVELLVVLALTISLFRAFAAEAYVVPTGSMAPTLLGLHKEVACGNCRFRYVVGMDEQGRSPRPVCPNCGQVEIDADAAVVSGGDRLLVHKYVYDLRPPRRWEVAVFQSPGEPSQAYVKRVVGLPGDWVQIRNGDLYVDGKIARKSLAEFRAIRQLVYDQDFVPGDIARFPRWLFWRGRGSSAAPSGWRAEGTGFVHEASRLDGDQVDWLQYRHWDPDSGRYGPVRDFTPYNGGDLRGANVASDLMVDARVSARPDARNLVIRVDGGADLVFVTLPIDGRARPEARRNGVLLEVENPGAIVASSPSGSPRWSRVEAGVVDRRLLVAIDGKPAFDPIEFDQPGQAPAGRFAVPAWIGVQGGGLAVADIKIYRDVYYTSALANSPTPLFGVDEPYHLGPDEYFVLGDNSPVSNDSRFWSRSPVVRRRDFLGKPFLVHLPGQLASVRVFGRSICWIPDPREIRYIR